MNPVLSNVGLLQLAILKYQIAGIIMDDTEKLERYKKTVSKRIIDRLKETNEEFRKALTKQKKERDDIFHKE